MRDVWLPTKTLLPFQATADLEEAKRVAFQEMEKSQQYRLVVEKDGLYFVTSYADLIHFGIDDDSDAIKAHYAKSWW